MKKITVSKERLLCPYCGNQFDRRGYDIRINSCRRNHHPKANKIKS